MPGPIIRKLYRPGPYAGLCRKARMGFTLIELVVVLTVMAVLTSFSVPSFRRTMEQSKADQASANLQALWSAQQLYWLEQRTYTNSLTALRDLKLIDPMLLDATGDYLYSIVSANDDGFSGRATRRGTKQWTGTLTIDQSGTVTGSLKSTGKYTIIPSFK